MSDPTPGNTKAVAAGAAGAATVIICWAVETFAHIIVPAEVALAVATVFNTGAVYLAPHQAGAS